MYKYKTFILSDANSVTSRQEIFCLCLLYYYCLLLFAHFVHSSTY